MLIKSSTTWGLDRQKGATVRGNARPESFRHPSLTTRSPCISPNFNHRNEWPQIRKEAQSVVHETKTQTPAPIFDSLNYGQLLAASAGVRSSAHRSRCPKNG